MASEVTRRNDMTVNSLQEGREWRDYALDLEKRARALCDKLERNKGFISTYPPIETWREYEALREILTKEVPDASKAKG